MYNSCCGSAAQWVGSKRAQSPFFIKRETERSHWRLDSAGGVGQEAPVGHLSEPRSIATRQPALEGCRDRPKKPKSKDYIYLL